MLNKLIIINSELYSKAAINLGTHESIQIVGPNNIGKSSLINALNFLYIIDPRLMRFGGKNKSYTLKESLNHYFPSLKTSYIIFEIKSTITYCILVKRNESNDVDYYYIEHAYDEKHFLDSTTEVPSVRPFEKLLKYFVAEGITCNEYKDRRKLNSKVYNIKGSKEEKDPIILLSGDRTGGKTTSNRKVFKKIYAHLIGSRELTAERLQEIVTDAYFPMNEKKLTVFRDRIDNDLKKFDKIVEKRKKLQETKASFEALKEAHNASHEKNRPWVKPIIPSMSDTKKASSNSTPPSRKQRKASPH